MENEAVYLLIMKFFDSPEDPVLKQNLDSWRALSSENEELYREAKRIWDVAAEVKAFSSQEAVQATDRFEQRLNERMNPLTAPAQKRAFSPFAKWLSAAAAVLVIGILGYWGYNNSVQEKYVSKSTESKIDSVLLADGTKIFLNEHTKVSFPEKFKGKLRTIILEEGEAFFNVAKDEQHPFIIRLNGSSVKVLGTSFNINNRMKRILLSVRSGKVMFKPSKGNEQFILNAGAGVEYNEPSGKVRQYRANSQDDDAWITHELNFIDAPLKEVCKRLEDYYQVKIDIVGKIPTIKKLNATFSDNKLDEVLEVLKETYKIDIIQKNKHIEIKKPK